MIKATNTVKAIFFALFVSFIFLAGSDGASRKQIRGDSVIGGKIYDNWMIVQDLPPILDDHPLWSRQITNTRSGAVTWRCVECHGWDYKGAEGAYGPGSSHYTGFPGLNDMVGATRREVIAWLDGTNNRDHEFASHFTPQGIENLVAFLLTQQVDTDLLIDSRTGAALAQVGEGRGLYREACQSCHGEDGRLINFGTNVNPIHLGDLADLEPAQTLHVVRFGDPYDAMPASEELGWSLSKVAAILAYAQTLPRSSPTLSVTATISQQGEILPIIWGAFGIFSVIVLGVMWEFLKARRAIRKDD